MPAGSPHPSEASAAEQFPWAEATEALSTLRFDLGRYIDFFAKVSVPTTVIDVDGVIVAINRAFSDYVRHATDRDLVLEERLGFHVCDFADPGLNRRQLKAFLEALLTTGESSSMLLSYEGEHSVNRELRGVALRDSSGEIVGAALLRRDATAEIRSRLRQDLLTMVREVVWSMEDSAEAHRLLAAIGTALRGAAIPFGGFSINRVDTSGAEARVRFCNPDNRQWQDGETADGSHNVLEFWREDGPVYRRDLEKDDPFSERGFVGDFYHQPIRCIIDIPFSLGTLGVNSTRPDAFSAADIEFLNDLAGVLGEGFHRMQDLEGLKRAADELPTSCRRAASQPGARAPAQRRLADAERRRLDEDRHLLLYRAATAGVFLSGRHPPHRPRG